MTDTPTATTSPTEPPAAVQSPADERTAERRPAGVPSLNGATTVTLTVDPDQTPAEEAELVARVAAAVAEDTGSDTINFELIRSEHVTINGSVADRMQGAARWSA